MTQESTRCSQEGLEEELKIRNQARCSQEGLQEEITSDLEGLEKECKGNPGISLGISPRCSQEGPEEESKGDLDGLEKEFTGDLGIEMFAGGSRRGN